MGTNKTRPNHGYEQKQVEMCSYIASCMRPLLHITSCVSYYVFQTELVSLCHD